MNVACTACPAKYAVPDERVRGKRARITCKHCGTSIIVDGTSLGPSDGSVVAARPARKTMLGMGQVGSSAVAASSPVASVPSNAPPSGGSAWLVALADGRREPASQARIVDLYAAGTIDAASYIWREGMPEWKTPFQIPEIAAALTARGLKPRNSSIPAAGEDPDEATRVAINVLDEPSLARARSAAARAASGTPKSEPPPAHDDGITIARSGPPSSPVSLPPLRAPSELPAARPQPPSALRSSAPPSAEPPARKPSEPPPPLAAPGRRPRAHTLPGDLVIPLTGPAAPPPTPLFAPRNQPFAARRTPSAPPGPIAPSAPSAMVAPSAMMVAPSAPPAPAPPADFPSAPPAPALPEAPLMAAPSPVNMPAPARPAAEFEVPPRSAAPVSVPLEFANFTQGNQRRGRTMTAVVAVVGVLAVGAVGFAAYWKSKAPQPKPPAVAVAPVPSPVAPTPPPSATAAEPSASAEAEPAAPSTEATKPSARERSAAAARPAAAAVRAASARKSEATKPETTEADTEPTSEADDSEAATARAEEAAKKAEEAAKKAEAQIGAGTAPFDRDAAATALSDAAMRTVSCRMLGGPTGSSQATVTFVPNGHVSSVSVGGDFAGSVVGACVIKLFRAASVPPFAGEPVTVAKRFTVE